MKQSKRNSERDIHTVRVRLYKDILVMMDIAIFEPIAFLIISRQLHNLYSSIIG
jgi:hypothetical protein